MIDIPFEVFAFLLAVGISVSILYTYMIMKPTQTIYIWNSVNKKLPTNDAMYLVVRQNQGKFGVAHFDMFCPGKGWMQVSNSLVGEVTHWMEIPDYPENIHEY